jgi:hypothetical protein
LTGIKRNPQAVPAAKYRRCGPSGWRANPRCPCVVGELGPDRHREPDWICWQYCRQGGRGCTPDGYTLLLDVDSNDINATLYDDLNFNYVRDIVPVAGIIRFPFVMVVGPSFPAATVPEFIA